MCFSKADTVASDAVQTLTQDALVRWYAASTQWPDLGGRFSPEEQSCCAQKIDAQFEQIDHSLAAGTRTPADAQKTLRVLVPCAVKIVEYALGAADEQVLQLLEKGMLEISLELASRARRLDPEVSLIDVLQAARNAWTACALQLFLGREMRLTPAIFAYSMLYPYSDNYLDDVASSPHVKLRFSERFRARLCGERLPATDAREALIWELVGIIEAQYSRERFPAVYDSLLAIHAAQQDSLCQLHNTLGPELDVADLTFTKGGTSVLADAYLAAGELCEAEAKMAFNWGVVLQLGDDLQDLHSDRERGSVTLFAQAAECGSLDSVTSRAFHFAGEVMQELQREAASPPDFSRLVARSSQMLYLQSAAAAHAFYSPQFLQHIEQQSPVRFEFIGRREKRFFGRSVACYQLFEQLTVQSSDQIV